MSVRWIRGSVSRGRGLELGPEAPRSIGALISEEIVGVWLPAQVRHNGVARCPADESWMFTLRRGELDCPLRLAPFGAVLEVVDFFLL